MKGIALCMLAIGGIALPSGLGCTSQTTAAAPTPGAGAVEEEEGDASDGGTTKSSGGDASDGGTTKSSGKDACEKLIACVADISPSQAGGYVNLYGDASNCWKGSAGDAEACGKACEEELDKRPGCNKEKDASGVGPECTAYFACCEEVASTQPSLAESCDASKNAVYVAIVKGASIESVESECKQALEAMGRAGYCK